MTAAAGTGRRGTLLYVVMILGAAGVTAQKANSERKSRVSTTVNQLEVDFQVLTPVITSAAKLTAVVVFTNKSARDMRLNALFLDLPKVLLKVRRAGGLPVNPGPPGMPPLDDGEAGRKVLKPDEFVSYQYTGAEYFGTELRPGKYEIQFRYENLLPQKGDWTGTIETDWLPFEVVKPLPGGRKPVVE